MSDVLADPIAATAAIGELDCVDAAEVVRHSANSVSLQVDLLPHDPSGRFIAFGYPVERVRILIRSDCAIWAVPKSRRGRSWEHRNGISGVLSDLCLWDPRDPAAIQWSWDDGLEEYIRIVSRHLIYEEVMRREGKWPVEDSPHGDPLGRSWPICTAEMRRAAGRPSRG
jgi:hypothetical protein